MNECRTLHSEKPMSQASHATELTDAELLRKRVEEKLLLATLNPALGVAFEPEEAELAGCFIEDAISFEDALESAQLGDVPNP